MAEKPKGRGGSKETPAQGADFIPGTESDEDFEKILSLLSGWINAGVARADIDSDGDVVFELPGEMRELFGAEIPSGLTKQHVLRIIRTEMPSLIGASLAEKPRQYLKSHVPEYLYEKLDDLTERGRKAATALVSKELKERILLRRTTLSYVIKEIQAVRGSYESPTSGVEKAKLPFTTVEFTFVRPRSPKTMIFTPGPEGVAFAIGQKDEVQIRVDLHRDDIKSLVKDLTNLIEKDRTS